MKRPVIVLALVAIALFGAGFVGVNLWRRPRRPPGPQHPAPRPPVGRIYRLDPRLWVIPEGGGNTAVFLTSKGVVLVDTKYTISYDDMIAQVRSVTDLPIVCAINTHCHGDHAGGNVRLPPGVEIVAQEKTAEHLEEMRVGWDRDDSHKRPIRTFTDRLTLFDGKDAVDLYHFGPAHTDGDTFVVFRDLRVMHAGDVFPGKVAPIVSVEWGGDGRTFADTITKAAEGISGVDRVIPGHAAVCGWSDFVDYAEFNRLFLANARAAFAAGKPSKQAFAELVLPPKFGAYVLDRGPATILEIYDCLRR